MDRVQGNGGPSGSDGTDSSDDSSSSGESPDEHRESGNRVRKKRHPRKRHKTRRNQGGSNGTVQNDVLKSFVQSLGLLQTSNNLKPFSGAGPPTLDNFRFKFEQEAKLRAWSADRAMAELFRNLEGQALRRVRTKGCNTVDEALNLLQRLFDPRKSRTQLATELYRIRQSRRESVTDFSNRFA